MKKIIVLAALLAAASACTPAEQGNTNNSNLAANANSATPMASPVAAAVSDADLVAQDKEIWETFKTKNWDGFAAHLADDAITVSGDGVYDKAQTVEVVKKMDLTDYTVSDTKVVRLDQDAAVLTYTSTSKGKYDGQPMPDTPSRDTTVFVKRGGKWLAIFHQETQVQPAGSNAAASNSNSAASNSNMPAGAASSPTATASPAAAPASVTDAEKQVWDLLKAKNWDGFAAFLTSDFVEVESDAVTDKAGSVAGVKQVDFSTTTLSDFKEVKLDADASILIYIVRGKGKDWPPKGMHHTSAWVNRGGKWQAAFHQGSIITK